MLDKRVVISLQLGLGLGVGGGRYGSLEGAGGSFKQLYILLLFVNCLDLPLQILLETEVVCPQPVVLFLDLHMELDLLVWISVTAGKLLILSPQHIQLSLKLPVGLRELLERLNYLGHLALSLLNLFLKKLIALRELVELVALLLVIVLHLLH